MKKSNLYPILGGLMLAWLCSACAIHPHAWSPATAPALAGTTAPNEALTHSEKIELGGHFGPEDIVFDDLGNLYCGVHDAADNFSEGKILKIDSTGKIETYYEAHTWVAGLHFDAQGNLIALSHREGLISISPNKTVTVLATADERGHAFLIPNGLDIAADGKIYFSNTSEVAPYDIRYGKKIILEMQPLGGLYCYDPATKAVKTLIQGTYFGNGVVLSQDESHLLMVETSRYRILRHWLRGPKAGQTEVFMDNLPGFPNGISIREDGSYWLGFSTIRTTALDGIHPKPGMKKFVYGLPSFVQPKAAQFGMVMQISAQGQILQTLMDTQGSVMPEAGAVKEYKGYLYLGGDVVPHIGRFRLPAKDAQVTE